ncbi:unnamed protein product [marine sediment metagenome]|uniref:Uncharacterized protein n=1 Tax=marine sediment metagenome TaxID=412755 RepID=X1LHW8_9ZZZZ
MKKKTKIAELLTDEEKELIGYHDFNNPDSPIYYNNKINVLDDLKSIELGNWDKVKNHMIELYPASQSLFFVAHKEDEITGKPQSIEENQKRIILSTEIRKKIRREEDSYNYTFKFLDDKLNQRDEKYKTCAIWFYIYKIVEDDKEYILFSQNKLIPDLYRFRGMKIILDDDSEMSKTLKFKSLTNVFISVDEEKAIKELNKKDLIKHIQRLKLNRNKFIDYLFTREDNKIYSHTENYSKLLISFLLSGKYEDYPLHLIILGRAGTGKTYSLESLDYKFKEDKGIFESSGSTLKGLIPSHKEKPAQLGFILNCVRIGLIDELFKMIEKQELTGRYLEYFSDYFGSLNHLLEHKDRTIASGVDSIRIKATAKLLFMTNPYKNKKTIYEHLDIMDSTTLSRMIPLIQTKEERELIKKKDIKINKNKLMTKEEFLTIYDSCNNFLIDYDEEKVKEIYFKTLNLIKQPMKEVWTARGLHHSILLLDGIVKFRCLFDEKEGKSFRAKKEDYEDLEKMLIYIIESWNFDLQGWKTGDSI